MHIFSAVKTQILYFTYLLLILGVYCWMTHVMGYIIYNFYLSLKNNPLRNELGLLPD